MDRREDKGLQTKCKRKPGSLSSLLNFLSLILSFLPRPLPTSYRVHHHLSLDGSLQQLQLVSCFSLGSFTSVLLHSIVSQHSLKAGITADTTTALF
jgi:hypothetical protein